MADSVTRPRRGADAAVERRSAMWAARIAAAETPREKAAVEWDWLRSEIRKFPSRAARDDSWETIRKALKSALDEIRAGQNRLAVEAGPHPSSRPAHPAARAAGFVYDIATKRRGA
jgi:hypothetical protein